MESSGTGGVMPTCCQASTGAGVARSVSISACVRSVTGISMCSGWPGAETMREWPNPTACAAESTNDVARKVPVRIEALTASAAGKELRRDVNMVSELTQGYTQHTA